MKKLLFSLIVLFLPRLLAAKGGVPTGPIQILDSLGRPRPGVTVTVCTSAGTGFPCTPLASIFTNAGLTNPSPNPLTTDGLGNLPLVFATPGVYVLSITGTGIIPSLMTATVAGTGGGNVVLNASNAFTGNNTHSGTETFNGALNANGGGTLVSPTITNPTITGTDSGAETLQNKTFDISANTLKSSTNTAGHVPRNNGTQYVDGQLAAADLSTPLQGTDANLLTAGTVSASTGVSLCTDANHGATTTGCSSGIPIAAANLTAQQANVGATTLTTPAANGFYRASCYIVLTQAATTSSTVPSCLVAWTDGDTSVAQNSVLLVGGTGNTVGLTAVMQNSSVPVFYAKSGVAITFFTTSYTSSGATPMQFAIRVRLEGPF